MPSCLATQESGLTLDSDFQCHPSLTVGGLSVPLSPHLECGVQ